MNLRRLLLEVDTAIERPTPLERARAPERIERIGGTNIAVTEIDVETTGMDVTIQGVNLDFSSISKAIESAGALIHSMMQ